jgi:hypothetical protein
MDKYLKAVYIAIGISFVTITICFFYPSFEVVNVIADFGIFYQFSYLTFTGFG